LRLYIASFSSPSFGASWAGLRKKGLKQKGQIILVFHGSNIKIEEKGPEAESKIILVFHGSNIYRKAGDRRVRFKFGGK
jgi:hypothetical protein